MIDHSRAFRRHNDLRTPEELTRMERSLWEKLKTVADEQIETELKPYLRKSEISGVLKRRQKLIEHFEKLIAQRGENVVLYTLAAQAVE